MSLKFAPLLALAVLTLGLPACGRDGKTPTETPLASAPTEAPVASPTLVAAPAFTPTPRPPAPALAGAFPLALFKDEFVVVDADGRNRRTVATTEDFGGAIGFLPDGAVWYTTSSFAHSRFEGALGRLQLATPQGALVLYEGKGALEPEWSADASLVVIRGAHGPNYVGWETVLLDRATGRTDGLGVTTDGIWFGETGYLYSEYREDSKDFRLMFARPGQRPERLVTTGASIPTAEPPQLSASDDLAYVLISTYGGAKVLLRIADGFAVELAAGRETSARAISPDGKYVLVGEKDDPGVIDSQARYSLYSVADGSRRPVFEGLWVPTAHWSPDGRRLAVIGWGIGAAGAPTSMGVYVLDTDTMAVREVKLDRGLTGVRWFPDGQAMLAWHGCYQCDGQPRDPVILTPDGRAVPYPEETFGGSVAAPPGSMVWGGSKIMRGLADGSAIELDATPGSIFYSPAVSPAGDKIAFLRFNAPVPFALQVDVTTGESKTVATKQLRTPSSAQLVPSPDGSRAARFDDGAITLVENFSDARRIEVPVQGLEGCHNQGPGAWSPNNVYFAFWDSCTATPYVVNFDDGSIVPLIRRLPYRLCVLQFEWSTETNLSLYGFSCGL